MKTAARVAIALAAFAGLVFLNNTSLFTRLESGKPVLLAHRGIAQQFDGKDLQNDTCTAARMLPPTHAYLENTLPSMRASFAAGADWVELDVHPTSDGHFAVFHDWTLDCRTEGKGVTREHSLAALKQLDVGYGYTADGGRTFPFRGKGVGLMPSLDEVLAAFPAQGLVINVKSRDPNEGVQLAAVLARVSPERLGRLIVYGGDEPVAQLRARVPGVRTASRSSLKRCLLGHITYGWTGLVPEACRRSAVLVPINVAPWLWGWPGRFQARLKAVGSMVVLIGPYHGGGFSTGIDSAGDVARLPQGWSGGVWTNELEAVAAALKKK